MKKRVQAILNMAGFSIMEIMVAVAVLGIVASTFIMLFQNMIEGQNTGKYMQSITRMNDVIRTTLSSKPACLATFSGLTLTTGSTAAITTIKNSDGTTAYALNTTYNGIQIVGMSLKMGTVASQAGDGTLTISYTATYKITGPPQRMRDINFDFYTTAGGVISDCISKAKMTDGLWRRRVSISDDIFYTDAPTGVGMGTAAPAADLHVYGTGSAATVATTGSADATMLQRACRGSICMDTGILNTNTGYIQNRIVSDFSLNYPLNIQPSGGNIGIGTTAPVSKLELGSGSISLGFFSNTANSFHFVGLHGNSGGWSDNSGAGGMYIKTSADGVSNNVGFVTHSSGVDSQTRMLIEDTGNIGIGTLAPLARLNIALGGTYVPMQIGSNGPATSNFHMAIQSSNFSIYNGNYGAGGLPLLFINSAGKVGISTAVAASPHDGQLVSFSGQGNVGSHGIYGAFTAGGSSYYGGCGSGGSYYGCLGRADGYAFVGMGYGWNSVNIWTGSDERLKENIQPMRYGMETLNKLRPVSFNWKKDTVEFNTAKNRLQMGLVAQEVREILPQVVNEFKWHMPKKGEKPTLNQKLGKIFGVDYKVLISVLIKGIQELYKTFVTLSEQVIQNSSRMDAIQAMMAGQPALELQHAENNARVQSTAQNQRSLSKSLSDLKTAMCEQDSSLKVCAH